MSDADDPGHASSVPNLADLIGARKAERGWSYQQLANRADGVVSRQRWQQLGTGTRIKEFPEPATIQAIADALEVDITLVVLAVARSIGFDVRKRDSSLAAMLPPAAARLSTEQRDAILAVVRAMAPSTTGPTHEDTSTQGPPANPAPRRGTGSPTPTTRAGDAGTQGSYELAARKGMTQRQWELANEPQAEDENQGEATDDGA